mmetsp:Transcript_6765/g.20513  ORF Transcript_6765/g.20513 Transcript_6765/m.20513 type:complete len:319 (-) Transcript_6765:57-1013(-)|eukprot:CAMPEP_0198727268 /NCGR_PEP_ID=MMETSP1475-20131203/4044_1 /TAXON_ID= ORGANISM="Unidentified sp., Strain CCMP1999" /NCGR_SAMPLE_ID=MMETSP1475 /ASSEMBLY_ACC=CAM_ASM_001111 /LENGTH=318 /DNA_ID=CAMNT_0044489279 /DNA_START=67 /DNA_END=1026 /DNA_ORIENTATION=+
MALRGIRTLTVGSRRLSSLAFTYSKGNLSAQEAKVPEKLGSSDVLVSFLACGVSPFDKVKEGSIAGTSGVGVVEKVGSSVKDLKSGDRVVPAKAGLGTWREVGVLSHSDLIAIPTSLKTEQAALLWSGPFTAFRILNDFKPSGTIAIAAAESAAGQALVQMAASKGVKTICFVTQNVPNYAPVVEGLKYLGATVVVPETYPVKHLQELVSDLGKVSLGVNLGGSKGDSALKHVAKSIVTVSNSSQSKGGEKTFSLQQWMDKASRKDIKTMIDEIADMHKKGQLVTLSKSVQLAALPSELNSSTSMPLRSVVGITSKAS